MNSQEANTNANTKRKILLKRKQNKSKQDFGRYTVDINSQRTNPSSLRPSRLSCKDLSVRNINYQSERMNYSLKNSNMFDSTLKIHRVKKDSQSTIEYVEPVTISRINNPNAKRIKVGLPYTNLNLIAQNWWVKYQGECKGSIKHGYGKLYMSNGQLFEGIFSNNRANGRGIYNRNSNQPVIEGIWKNNILVQRI